MWCGYSRAFECSALHFRVRWSHSFAAAGTAHHPRCTGRGGFTGALLLPGLSVVLMNVELSLNALKFVRKVCLQRFAVVFLHIG